MSTVSIIIPAYNEEDNLKEAIQSVKQAVKGVIREYEILIIDDAGQDRTGEIADAYARQDKTIKVIHNKVNIGFGKSFMEGVRIAKKEYITGFPGDNDMSSLSLRRMLEHISDADLVISYMSNPEVRPMVRRVCSAGYILLMNLFFRLHLRYFNGYFVAKTELLRKTPVTTNGLDIFSEIKVRLISAGASYVEVPFEHIPRKHGTSTALSFKNIFESLTTIGGLLRDIYFV